MLCSTGAEGHALLQRRLGSGTLQLARLFKIHKCHQPQCGLIPSELLDALSSELLDETSGGGNTSAALAHSRMTLRTKSFFVLVCLSLVSFSAARMCHVQ